MTVKGAVYVGSLCAAVLVAVGFGPWQTKQKPKTTTPQTESSAQTEPVELGHTGPDFQFPNPWPSPLARPEGSVDDVAEILARKVLAGGADALPALERAALESGFAIHGEHGEVLYKPEKSVSVGVSMLDLDLAIAAQSTARKDKTTMADLQKQASDMPGLKGISLADLFALNVTSMGDAGDDQPGMRFWGQFVQALGWGSDGQFDDCTSPSERNVLCDAQVKWLLYMAAAQAAVVKAGPKAEPAQEPPAETPPPAEDPPPHGPMAQQQQQIIDDAITDLTEALQLTADPDFQQNFQSVLKDALDSDDAMVVLARESAIDKSIKLRRYGPQKLVRTKTFGDKGGVTTIRVQAVLSVDPEVRRRYQAAVAALPAGHMALPPNGPLKATFTVTPPDECEVDPNSFPTTGGYEAFTLTAKEQTRHISNHPVPDDYTRVIGVTALTDEYGFANFDLNLDIRDWQSAGLSVRIEGTAKGSGTLSYPGGGKSWWSINRKMIGYIQLTVFNGAPSIHHESLDIRRFKTWMQYPGNPNYAPLDWLYWVNDRYKSKRFAGGCGGKPGATSTGSRKDVDRDPDPDEAPQISFSSGTGELDDKNSSLSLDFVSPVLPIMTTPGRRKDVINLVKGIKMGSTAPHSVGPNLQFMDISIGSTTGFVSSTENFHFDGEYDSGGTGNKHVDVDFKIGLKFDAPSNSPPNSMAMNLGEAKSLANEVIESILNQPSATSSYTIDDSRPTGHGPLWISDASAATCSEIDIDDQLPPSVLQRKQKA